MHELKDNINPVFKSKRNVPFLILESVNQELEYLEEMGVTSKVEYLDWVSPTIYVKNKEQET